MLTSLTHRFQRVSAWMSRCWADRSGSLTTLFAFSAIPLTGIVGLATDYGLELAAKSKLDHAADAAVIAAITSAQTYILNYTGTGDPTTAAIAVGKAQALAQFKANTGSLPASVPTPTIALTASGLVLNATASYSFSMPTIFMKAFGAKVMNFSGSASSTLTVPPFTNIHIVIDVSSSMGIGATQTDQQTVYSSTAGSGSGSCAFACHYTGTDKTARNAGATLRIDVAKSAVIAALNQITSSANAGRFQVAIYTMSSQFTTVMSLGTDIAGAITKVQGIDLSNATYDGGTDTTNALKSLNSSIATTGSGLTASTARGYVMLITDGVQTSIAKYWSNGVWQDSYDKNFVAYSPCSNPNCKTFTQFAVPVVLESFDPSACSPIKTKGYTFMTLNTKYIVPPQNLQGMNASQNAMFDFVQNYLASSIATNLSSCATSTPNAFSADSPTEINAAVSQMFAAAMSQARITQ